MKRNIAIVLLPLLLQGCVMVGGSSQVEVAQDPAPQDTFSLSPFCPMYHDTYIDASGGHKKVIVDERYAPRPQKK